MSSFFLSATALLLAFGLSSVCATTNVIVPGAKWNDTSGNSLQAHGGGFLKVGGASSRLEMTGVLIMVSGWKYYLLVWRRQIA